jgi:hypothetical protein
MPIYRVNFRYRPKKADAETPDAEGHLFIEAKSPGSAERLTRDRLPTVYAIDVEPMPYVLVAPTTADIERLLEETPTKQR